MDRTVPAPFRDTVGTSDWLGFCDKIDGIAEKSGKMDYVYYVLVFLGFLSGGIMVLLGFLWRRWILAVLGFVDFIFTFVLAPSLFREKEKTLQREIADACVDFSLAVAPSHVSIAFRKHNKNNNHDGSSGGGGNGGGETDRSAAAGFFFEIVAREGLTGIGTIPVATEVLATQEAIAAEAVDMDAVAVSVPPGSIVETTATAIATAATPSERMQQLENMKGMITREQYEAKQKEILDSV